MQIYPAIDLKNGQCVRLKQGRFDDVTFYGNDPVERAGEWIKAGATYIHVVDLDGARTGNGENLEAIKKIAETYKVSIETGGGIRTMRDIEERIKAGVSRVIIGTAAVKNPDLVKDAVKVYGEKIAVGIDASNGMVAIDGWEKISNISSLDLCRKMAGYGVKYVIYTDISKDGMMSGPNIESTKKLIEKTGINIIASGGVTTMKDIENAAKIGAEGVIIGKALYQGKLNLKEVIDKFEKR
ncbi:MAG: 1-(5-phosphoribosyl)-5-[(5-phosphoribosylamino)methylideneamino]imidazole-4-carboxamide isomerase [Clostridia bacterium]|jgi:phosphoribosylformimino-5-aminoimidazole carboxamide ribotide isomerase|nr:1-(5-phosphoribosyl)-5-[(5-phosphoribosylamino)methylideneamino]imidazole-4-carboxamide isomerase [Clostridia bacterium]MCI2000917.1 1-(5-phosphoribosyl)-5-[(5-phosphoribosylamino)methylideneamino]imidazole-4-carboxamide isomerase [Clostridia bacterium]MCI2015701.1 1-(5-phosphoribosyl)-5-[(5-phosphoribosylamino)methylideneamino]imidazole-4-carboxamide isomerase [Clostridia bacterium]